MSVNVTRDQFAVDGVVEYISKYFAPHAIKGEIKNENKYGVGVLFHKKEIGVIQFTFVTEDMIRAEMIISLRTQKPTDIAKMMIDVVDGVHIKREERASKFIIPELNTVFETNPLVIGIKAALGSQPNQLIH